MSSENVSRVAIYVDGFNLYHALDDIKEPHLKWLNLAKLSRLLIRSRSQRIVSVKYFSAFANHFSNTPSVHRLLRHRQYVAALKAKGVQCFMGNFARRDHRYKGKGYRARWRRFEEKQTDVGIASHLLNDAHKNVFDEAFVVCVDTDMIPVFSLMKAEFPTKPVTCVAPPKRQHHASIQEVVPHLRVIKVSQIEKSLFGPRVQSNGSIVATRPTAYSPPRID